MNEIYKRRSIRKFKDIPVENEKLKEILKAGMNAPSACNKQPWEFVIIRDREKLNKISEFAPSWHMLKESPIAIVVCGNTQKSMLNYWIQDCSASIQNILLQATTLNIGTVWLGTTPIEERVDFIKKMINAPKHIEPLGIIALGYGDEEKEPNDKFNEELVIEGSY